MDRVWVKVASMAMLTVLVLILACTSAPAPGSTTGGTAGASADQARQASSSASGAQSAKQPGSVSFQGKTITLLVPWSPGGSADIMARQFAPTFRKYLPGNPTVIIQNMPGAGEIVGENWLYNIAPKDGTVMGQFSSAVDNFLLSRDQVQFDLAKLQWLGAVSESRVTFASSSLGVSNVSDLARSGKQVLFGGTSPSSTRDMGPRLLLELLGMNFKYVSGFGSSGDMRSALLRGEINMTVDSLSGYYAAVMPMVEEGVVVLIAQQGIIRDNQVIRDPRVGDLPTYEESVVEIKGATVRGSEEFQALNLLARMNAFTRGFVYPPGVPEETVLAVREAIGQALADPELRESYKQSVGLEIITLNGRETQEAAEAVVTLVQSNPKAMEVLHRLAKAES